MFGADPDDNSGGEVVFNTGMSGYHEILTDPSYTGQIVTMTYPHIGNYGDDPAWSEGGPENSERKTVKVSGLVMRSVYRGWVPQGRSTLDDFLKENEITGITDVDTRALTLKLREMGSLKGCIITCSFESGKADEAAITTAVKKLKAMPDMQGMNLIGEVGTSKMEIINPDGKLKFSVIDCGIKANIINELTNRGVAVTLLPSTTTAEEVLASKPDGVLFSNGPGDPSVLEAQIETVKNLIGRVPVFGICLGHQLISLGLGAETYKMKFGHHGINNPVRDELTGKVFVSSQNHGFAVKEDSLPKDVKIWFTNANDKSVEGIISTEKKVASVQFHPEAAPGPVDTSWIFDDFIKTAAGGN
jgi:carbamoyl-phosphate synthase small subunit